MIAEIEKLMRDDTAGDPISGIKWTRKTSEKISRQLRRVRIWVSASTIRRLLKKLDFHLHVNKKTICNTRSADRDRQFKHIRRACARFRRQGLPIISVDTKKREMIGLFKNAGPSGPRPPVPSTTTLSRHIRLRGRCPCPVVEPRRPQPLSRCRPHPHPC